MSSDTAEASPIMVRHREDGELVLSQPWPERASIPDSLVRVQRVKVRYPYMVIWLGTDHAVYQVETCDQGVWVGDLVEGWSEEFQEPKRGG